jgi:hypothetical protein
MTFAAQAGDLPVDNRISVQPVEFFGWTIDQAASHIRRSLLQLHLHCTVQTTMLIPSLRQTLCPSALAAATALLQQSSSTGAALHSWAQPSQVNPMCLLSIKQQPSKDLFCFNSESQQHRVDQGSAVQLPAGTWQQQQQQHVEATTIGVTVLQQQLTVTGK